MAKTEAANMQYRKVALEVAVGEEEAEILMQATMQWIRSKIK
jgi:hypothetical protein